MICSNFPSSAAISSPSGVNAAIVSPNGFADCMRDHAAPPTVPARKTTTAAPQMAEASAAAFLPFFN